MTVQAKLQKGFTLIELLVVIGILAILLAITLIAINPARQFGQANDTKRRSDTTAILDAIGQYTASNGGNLPSEVTGLAINTPTDLSSTTSLAGLCAKLTPTYIPALPADPAQNNQAGVDASQCGGVWDTLYSISRDANNRITVSANGYSGALSVTR